MQIKGEHTIKYTIEGEREEIKVRVELKQTDKINVPRQNVWYAVAILNNREIDHPDLSNCVNAQYMAEEIANKEIKKLRAEHGRALRIKRK